MTVSSLAYTFITKEPLTIENRLRLLVESLNMVSEYEFSEPLPDLKGPNKGIVQILFAHQSLKVFQVQHSGVKLFGLKPKTILTFWWEQKGVVQVCREFFHDQVVSGIQLLDLLKLNFIILIWKEVSIFQHPLGDNYTSNDSHVFNCSQQFC